MSRLTRDGTAEPVSRDQILRHARGQGNIIFPVQLTTSRIGNLTRLIHTLLYVMTIQYCSTVVMVWTSVTSIALVPRAQIGCRTLARLQPSASDPQTSEYVALLSFEETPRTDPTSFIFSDPILPRTGLLLLLLLNRYYDDHTYYRTDDQELQQ